MLGVGTSDTWTSLVSGTNYLGANGIAANGGSGTGIIFSDGDHLAVGTQSTRISDGSIQTAVLDPALVQGTRRNLTDLDIALLQDLGFKTFPTAAIPEPSSLALLTLGGVLFAFAAESWSCRSLGLTERKKLKAEAHDYSFAVGFFSFEDSVHRIAVHCSIFSSSRCIASNTSVFPAASASRINCCSNTFR